ncbi:hypothetical protein ACGIF2_05065 [Cellulomonas sp. P22]|uniref:hypothetical protein n=1 Tax=Cellulomonas sp. P22 TaxID=3373189 RepID=UPI0037B46198
MAIVDLLGWAGSALLVYSVLQSRMLRFRVLNLAASFALLVFNALIAVWPMAAMNAALCLINVWFIVSLVRSRRAGRAFAWVPVAPQDAMLAHFLARHGADVAQFSPTATLPAAPGALHALVLHDDVVAGLVVAEPDGPGSWRLVVDYVVPGYRDYTAGSFLYSDAGPFAAEHARRVVAGTDLVGLRTYLARAGFTPRDDGSWVRDLAPVTAGA